MKDAVSLFDVSVNDDLLGIFTGQARRGRKGMAHRKTKRSQSSITQFEPLALGWRLKGKRRICTPESVRHAGSLTPMVYHKQADSSEVGFAKDEILALIEAGANLKISIEVLQRG